MKRKRLPAVDATIAMREDRVTRIDPTMITPKMVTMRTITMSRSVPTRSGSASRNANTKRISSRPSMR